MPEKTIEDLEKECRYLRMMLGRIIRRHEKGLLLDETLKDAKNLLKKYPPDPASFLRIVGS